MDELGLYQPGRSVLHRTPAWVKLVVLLLLGASSVRVDEPWQAGSAIALALGLHAVAGSGVATVGRSIRPLVLVLAVLGVFHALASGAERALVVTGVVLALVLLAAVVTVTTRTTEIVDVLVRAAGPLRHPLRRLGLDPERLGLLLALSIRSVPVVATLAGQVRDAQRARGLDHDVRAFAVPLVVRSVRHAEAVGEALAARGVDD